VWVRRRAMCEVIVGSEQTMMREKVGGMAGGRWRELEVFWDGWGMSVFDGTEVCRMGLEHQE